MPNRAALLMLLYAAVMVLLGVLAYASAPPDAKALTAIIIPAVCAVFMVVCAVLSWRIDSNRTMGMVGIHLGLILPLVFGGAFFLRAGAAFTASGKFRAAGDVVEATAAHVPLEASAPTDVYYLTVAERAQQAEAQSRGNTSRGEAILERGQQREAAVQKIIDDAIIARQLSITSAQRRHAQASLALMVGDAGGKFPTSDKAYLGRILMLLFGVSLAFFVAILAQRGSATSTVPVAKPSKGKKSDTGRVDHKTDRPDRFPGTSTTTRTDADLGARPDDRGPDGDSDDDTISLDDDDNDPATPGR